MLRVLLSVLSLATFAGLVKTVELGTASPQLLMALTCGFVLVTGFLVFTGPLRPLSDTEV